MIPSAQEWLHRAALGLLSGSRMIVRGLPRSGKTWLAESIRAEIGGSALLVRGREFTESNQAEKLTRITSDLRDLVSAHGFAQLIFDDYHAALRLSRGRRLQAGLVSILVDSDVSSDLGAIFFGRQAARMHLKGRGSPLLSRLDIMGLPYWGPADLQELNPSLDEDEVSSLVGRSICHLHMYLTEGYEEVVNRLKVDADSIIRDLPDAAIAGLIDETRLNNLDPQTANGIFGLLHKSRDGLRWCMAARDARLKNSIVETAPWPSTLHESALAFAELLEGCDRAIWSDRFLSANPAALRSFLVELRRHTNCQLNLLMSDWHNGHDVALSPLIPLLELIDRVDMRVMTRADRRDLHDRHLARLGEPGGWVVPSFDVVSCTMPAGSAVATEATAFGVDYELIWARSLPVKPL